ncbi:thioredoxin domain-containing protein [Agrococcus sp. ARC_14]|uniref:DsbA family protein n=1 Tax=Agrococcus sp. ARC_14 TaxID=2919927 RepID=UPI001F05890B|nr:thioredoxin domain-containing protein [Agrococcus sp. ARC_14]MCH1883292.1 DsbA family protein [Agrococcus sp. ARC_14]
MSKNAAASIAAVVGAFVLIVAVALLVVRPWERAQPEAGGDVQLVEESTHVLDDAGEGAPVVVEFFDYECPACGQFHPVVEDLRERYEGQVTFAVRYFPLQMHANAVPAAAAAEAAAQQDQFEAMHSRIFETQAEWTGTDDAAATFRGFAEELGLDMAAYDEAVTAEATADRIALDYTAGVEAGVESTPTFFVDGTLLELQNYDDLETAIQAALDE